MKTKPILAALVSAMAVHGLVLSYLQLQRPRVGSSPSLQSPDNTPELLQLSREPAPLSQLDQLPMPIARLLPPPPPPPPPLPVKAPEAKPKAQERKTKPSMIKPGRLVKPAGGVPAPASATTPEGFKDLVAAVEALGVFQGQVTLAPAQQDPFNTLWAEARPYRATVPLSTPQLPFPLEIRSMPLHQAKSNDLPIRHQQFVVMNERVALFWLDGSRVWILLSALPDPSSQKSDSPLKNRPDG